MSFKKDTKRSAGIACCRYGKQNNNLEILLIKKRYTYNFMLFVLGNYNKRDEKTIRKLFNGMTLAEKIDIMSLRFDILWYRIWMEFPESKRFLKNKDEQTDIFKRLTNTCKRNKFTPNVSLSFDFYIKKKNKFESCFLSDNGSRLHSLLMGTKNANLIWEIPKGRKKKKETMLDCAIREFKEETGVGLDSYTIMFDIRPIVESYISSNTTYIHNYQIAYTNKEFTPKIGLDNYTQVQEVAEIRWVNIDEVKYLDVSEHLYPIVNRIFNVFKSKYVKCRNR